MTSLLKPFGATIRTEIEPGDIGAIVRFHGVTYSREYGFDPTFEAYVAGPLAEFALRRSPRERIWIAERGDSVAGCVAIVGASPDIAQLRWFLVKVEEKPGRQWGVDVVEERYDLGLT